MSKVYIGLDVHKATISVGVATVEQVWTHGKCSSDLGRFVTMLRKLLKKQKLLGT